MKYNFFLIFTSFIVSLFLAEITLSVFFPQNLNGSWRVKHESGIMLNKDSGKAKHEYNDISINYVFDKYHNRITVNKRVDKKIDKILILGDSFTFGWLLKDSDTYTHRLQEAMPEYDLINASAGGWGLYDYTTYNKLFCEKIKPVKTYVFMNYMDIDRVERKETHNTFYDNNFLFTVKEILNHLPFYNVLLEKSHFLSLLRTSYIKIIVHLRNSVNDTKIPEENEFTEFTEFTEFDNLILQLSNDSQKCNSQLTIVNLGWKSFSNSNNNYKTIKYINSALERNFFKEKNINFINLSDTKYYKDVYLNRKSYEILGDHHPNKAGAMQIFSALKSVLP